MRIAQVAPLWESVPPQTYGGTELVVSLLTEELVRRGHEVTLFAAGNSKSSAKLESLLDCGLRELKVDMRCDQSLATIMANELRLLGQVFARADEFDVIHNHLGFQALPFADFVRTPVVTTLHNGLDPQAVRSLYNQYAHLAYIPISNYQRQLWPELYYPRTIYHGIETQRFNPRFEAAEDAYLVFLGRMYPEKGAHLAVEIARTVGRKLILAGKIDDVAQGYYDDVLAPLIDGEQISYIGEVNHEQKVELLRNAAATLCPVQWPEPFGLVLIESLACGTPVLALRNGSIPEIIDHGRTGFVGDSVCDLTEAFAHLNQIDRRVCRREVEERFSVERMVDEHEQLYRELITGVRGATQGQRANTMPQSGGRVKVVVPPQANGPLMAVSPDTNSLP